jgi:hypothetical protein
MLVMSPTKVPSPSSHPRVPRLAALVHDARADLHHRLFRFTTHGGASKELLILNQTFAEGDRAVVRKLAEADYPVPSGSADQRRLVQAIEEQRTERRLAYVDQVGWRGDLFVLPDEVLGQERSNVYVVLREGYPAHKFACAGSLDDWRSEVAALAVGNHVLMFALALAFVPPLLRLLGDEPSGFQLVAPTRTGKSTAAELAASAWGNRFAEKWRTTVNSVERTAADHNDLLLVLDEIGLLGKNPRSRADELYEACHQLGGGRSKQRLNVADPPWEWLVLFLSTSELTFRQILAAGGRAVVGGELMRLIDVELPVDPSAGIFQDLHGHATVDQYCAALDHAVARCHGTAGRAYLRQLVREVESDRGALVSWLRERIGWYLRRTSSAVQGREAEAVASRFALVYAAGRLAAAYKILPWSWREILAAVRYCHEHACVEAEAAAPALRAAPAADEVGNGGGERLELLVAEYVARHRAAFLDLRRFRGASLLRMQAAPGFLRERQDGELELLLLPAKFRQAVCDGRDPRAVVEALRRHDLIRLDQGGKTTIPRDLPPPLHRTRVVCLKGEILRFAEGTTPAGRRPKRR